MINGTSVSLVMVVKNEAKTLARAISSVYDVVDEVIIAVDRSSEDDSLNIAKRWAKIKGGQAFPFDWKDDFAAARNLAIGRASSDWIFILDGHEYLEQKSLPLIIGDEDSNLPDVFTRCPDADVFSPVIFLKDSEGQGRAWQHRLFKKRFRYEGQIHNWLSLEDEDIKVGLENVVIVHDRPSDLAAARSKQRHEMYPRIFKKVLAEKPDDIRGNYYMGVWYANHREWQKAIDHFERYLATASWDIERAKVAGFAGMCYREMGRFDEASKILKKASNERWDCAQAWIELGDIAAIKRDALSFEDDKEEIIRLVQEAEFYYTCAARCKFPLDAVFLDNDDYTWKPWVKLASLYDYCFRIIEDTTVIISIIEACHKALQFPNLPESMQEDIANSYNTYLAIYRQAKQEVLEEAKPEPELEPSPSPDGPLLSHKIGAM